MSGSEAWVRPARFSRYAGAICVATLLLAQFWLAIPPLAQGAILIAAAYFAITAAFPQLALGRKHALKVADKQTSAREAKTREIDWIAARWPNPMLIRDLRSRVRAQSIGKTLWTGALSTAITLAIFWAILHFKWWTASPFMIAWFVVGQPLVSLLSSAGSDVATRWKQEQENGTFTSLALTPLGSREILTGRLLASAAYTLAAAALHVSILVAVAVWASSRLWAGIFPLTVGVLASIVCRFVSNGAVTPDPVRATIEYPSPTAWQFYMLGVGATALITLVASLLPWWAGLALSPMVAASFLPTIQASFRSRVAELDALRASGETPQGVAAFGQPSTLSA